MPTTFNPDKIIARLTTFNYKHYYHTKDSIIKIYLSFFCILKINFKNDKIKITGHSWLSEERLEWRILVTAVFLGIFIYFNKSLPNRIYIFCGFGMMLSYFAVCLIKTETMKAIIHNWIEKDSLS
jgi:hypothetical protein